jgi:hypothetical protein
VAGTHAKPLRAPAPFLPAPYRPRGPGNPSPNTWPLKKPSEISAPKHGSWLDLAESELAVSTSQCLDRRIPAQQTLIEEIAAWENARNVQTYQGALALNNARRQYQTQAPLPLNLIESGD